MIDQRANPDNYPKCINCGKKFSLVYDSGMPRASRWTQMFDELDCYLEYTGVLKSDWEVDQEKAMRKAKHNLTKLISLRSNDENK